MKADDIFKQTSHHKRKEKSGQAEQVSHQPVEKFTEPRDALPAYAHNAQEGASPDEQTHKPIGTEDKEYEFNEQQNETIRILANRMKWVGILLIVLGAEISLSQYFSLQENPGKISDVLLGMILVLIGAWTRGAAKSFAYIVKRKGRDIANLMAALSALKKIYSSEFWLLIIFLLAVHFLLVLYIMIEQGGYLTP